MPSRRPTWPRPWSAAGATQVWLAGQPGDRAASDAAAGVAGYLFVGCDALDVLTQTYAALEVAE